jgi:hypothetical protein
MSNDEWLTFEKSLTVATFLGGFALGVLTFLIQLDVNDLQGLEKLQKNLKVSFLPSPQGYKEMLIAIAGMAGALLILSVFAIKIVIVDKVERNRKFARVALLAYELGLIALLVLLPLLIIPFSGIGAVIIISIEAGLILMIGVYLFRKHRKFIFSILDRIRLFFKPKMAANNKQK